MEQSLKELQSKYPTQYNAFLKEKGLDWITNNIKYQDNIINGMALLYYYHYLESSIGKNEWQKGKSTDAKIDRIYDSIIDTYVDSDSELSLSYNEWYSSNERNYSIDNIVFENIWAGVF